MLPMGKAWEKHGKSSLDPLILDTKVGNPHLGIMSTLDNIKPWRLQYVDKGTQL